MAFEQCERPGRTGPGHGGEWRTWLVAGAIYGGWFLLTYHAAALSWWLLLPAGAFIVCWHGSLQHETVHGHPTRSARANLALAWLPLGLWMPYEIYRDTHLRPHACPALTDPVEDTESYFVRQGDWDRMSGPNRLLLQFNRTLFGRLTLGPALAALALWRSEFRRIRSGDRSNAGIWLRHVMGAGLVLGWVVLAPGGELRRDGVPGHAGTAVVDDVKIVVEIEEAAHRPAQHDGGPPVRLRRGMMLGIGAQQGQ
jgi:fatty acid desaturase